MKMKEIKPSEKIKTTEYIDNSTAIEMTFTKTESVQKVRNVSVTYKFKNEEDRMQYDKLNKKDKDIFDSFLKRRIIKDGMGSQQYLNKRQYILVEEIIKYIYRNGGKVSGQIFLKEVLLTVRERVRKLAEKYNNKVSDIRNSDHYWILCKIEGKFQLYKSSYGSLKINFLRLKPQFLTVYNKKYTKLGEFRQFTVIKLSPLAIFLGRILTNEDFTSKKDDDLYKDGESEDSDKEEENEKEIGEED